MTENIASLLSDAAPFCDFGPDYVRAVADAAADLRGWFQRGFDSSYAGVSLDADRLRSLILRYS